MISGASDSLRSWLLYFFVMAGVLMLLDFCLPGKIVESKVIKVGRERQEYYNAARNYHYSYNVVTADHTFPIAESPAASLKKHDPIEYAVSPIFREVNWFRRPSTVKKEFHSLRIATGLAFPMLAIFFLLFIHQTKHQRGTLSFILQVLIIANMVYLLF